MNQFRMLKNNLALLAQMIGQVFMPIVASLLPYLNALVIVLQRVFMWIAKIFNIDLSGIMPQNTGGMSDDMADLLSNTEDVGDALDDDTDSAKKFKKQLQGFDALNNLTTKDDKDKGIDSALASGLLDKAFLDAVNDYLKAWDKAFNQLENDAKRLADRLEEKFKNLIAPIRRAWEKLAPFVVKSWKKAFKSIGKLLESLRISFWRVWGEKDTQKVFEHIFSILGKVGEIFSNLADRFREAWDENLNGYKILKAVRDIALTIVEHFDSMADSVVEWSKNINFAPLLSQLGNFLQAFNEVVGHLLDIMQDFLDTVLLPLGKWTIEEGLPKLLQVFIDFKDRVDWEGLKSKLKTFMEHLEPFAEKVGEGLILFIDDCAKALADFVNSEKFEHFLKKVEDWMDNVTPRDVADGLQAIAWGIIALKGALLGFKIIDSVTKTITVVSNFLKLFGAGGALAGASGTINSISTAIGGLSSAIFMLGYGDGLVQLFKQNKKAKFGSEMFKYADALKGGTQNIEDFVSALDKVANKAGNSELNQLASQLQDSFKNGLIDVEAYYRGMQKITEYAEHNKENAKWYSSDKFFNTKNIEAIAEEANLAYEKLGEKNAFAYANGLNSAEINVADSVVGKTKEQIEASSPKLEESGKKMVDYTFKGLSVANKVLPLLANDVSTNTAKSLDSKTNLNQFNNAGNNSIDSYSKGLSSKDATIITNATALASRVASSYNNSNGNLFIAGANMMVGLSNGMESKKPNIISRAIDFANNITKTFKSIWEIHSPSRVMDDVGVYFMQGLQTGIESMYSPIKSSISQFGNELAEAPNIEETLGYSGSNANISASSTTTFNSDNSETNSLLRQQNSLLQAILEKDMGISEGALFKSVQNSATSYYRMTGNRAFT